jgi:hypothetical protein
MTDEPLVLELLRRFELLRVLSAAFGSVLTYAGLTHLGWVTSHPAAQPWLFVGWIFSGPGLLELVTLHYLSVFFKH